MNYSNQIRLVFGVSLLLGTVAHATPSQVLIANSTDQDLYLAPYYCAPGKEAVRAGGVQQLKAGAKLAVVRPEKKRKGKWSPSFYQRQVFVASRPDYLQEKFNEEITGVHMMKIGDFSPAQFKVSVSDIERTKFAPEVATKAVPMVVAQAAAPQAAKKNKAVVKKESDNKFENSLARLAKLDDARKKQEVAELKFLAHNAAAPVEVNSAIQAANAIVEQDEQALYQDDKELMMELDALEQEIKAAEAELMEVAKAQNAKGKTSHAKLFDATMKKGSLVARK